MTFVKSKLKIVILAIFIFICVFSLAAIVAAQETADDPTGTEAQLPDDSEGAEEITEPAVEVTEVPTEEPTPEPTATMEPAVQKQANLASGASVAKVSPPFLSENDLMVAEDYSSLEEVVYLRSENPYRSSTTKLIRFSLPGAQKLKIRFESDFNLESGYDIFGIYVFDGTTNDYRLVDNKTYSGTDLAGQVVEIDSGAVVLRFESDSDVELSGWRVANVEAEMPEETTESTDEPDMVTETAEEETVEATETETESVEPTATPAIESTPTAVDPAEIPTVTAQPTPEGTEPVPTATIFPSFYTTDEIQIYGEESAEEMSPEPSDPRNLGTPSITKIWKENSYNSQTGATEPALKFRWTPVNGATGYRVWYSSTAPGSGYTNAFNFGPNVNLVTFFAANHHKTYYFRVAALKNGTIGKLSNVVGGRISIGLPALNTPVKAGSNQVRLSWSAVPGATGYRIWRSETSASAGYNWAVNVGNVTSIVSSIPNSSKTYYYRVAAVVANMVGPLSSPKPYRAALSRPTMYPVTRVSANSLRVSWTAVPGATGYRLWRSETSPTSGYNWAVNVGNVTATVTSVPSTKTYYYRVAAISGSTVGALSAPVSGTTAMGRPTMNPISNVAGGSFRVSWSAVPGATSYNLYRSEIGPSSGFTWAINVGKKTAVITQAPNIYKRYYYKVAAVFNGQVGPLSNVVSGMHDTTVFRAMTVGEGAYLDNDALNGTIPDSIQVANAFRHFRLNGKGFASVNQYSNLTKNQILGQISANFSSADSNDVSLFYFSGHGTVGGGIGYLYTVDREYISSFELRNALDRIPGTKYVIIDACNSGSFIGKSPTVQSESLDPAASADAFSSAFTAAFAGSSKRIDKPGYFVLTAAHSSELSWEYRINGKPVGIFTYFLLEGIGWSHTGGYALGAMNADFNGNRIVTFTEAFNYAYAKVKTIRPDQSIQIYPAGTSQLLFAR